MDKKMVSLRINDIPVTVPEGTTVLEAARSAGFNIPSLCYLKDVNEIGACRICVVEVKGAKSLVASCVYPVAEGMEVHTNTERVRQSRRLTLELILSNHRMDCLTCARNAHCELRQLASDLCIDAALLPGGEEARHIPGVQGQGTHGKRAAGRDASAVIGHKLRRAAADVGQQAGRSAASRGGALEGKRGLVRAGEDLHGQAGHLPYGLHSVLGVDNVAQRGGAEDVQVMEAEVIQQGAEPGQRPAGHQDAAVGERAVLDIACQPGHHFFVQQQLELRPLPAVDGQPDGVGAYVRNAAFHGKHLALFGLVCIRLSLRAFRADINGIYESFTWDPCPYPPRRRPPGSRLPVPRAGRRSAPDCPPAR